MAEPDDVVVRVSVPLPFEPEVPDALRTWQPVVGRWCDECKQGVEQARHVEGHGRTAVHEFRPCGHTARFHDPQARRPRRYTYPVLAQRETRDVIEVEFRVPVADALRLGLIEAVEPGRYSLGSDL